jgi:glycosyltransferase involved in cell wall biosynthesis
VNTPPAISIIIVTYNAAGTLQACLDSIYRQQYPSLKIIIIDGNSTDGTVDIIKANINKIHYWQSEPDNGVYDAMNKAVKQLTGDWVYFIGADDELLPEFSDMALELKDNTAIYYGNVFAEGSKRLGELTRYQIAKCGPYHQAMIYPRSVFDKHQYNTRYKISADFALTLELCGDSDYHFVYKDYTICNFNHTGLSGTVIDKPFQTEKAGLVFKNFGLKTWFRYRFHKLKHRNNPRA